MCTTLLQNLGFCENEQTVRAWYSLFYTTKKVTATQQPFANFHKPHKTVREWNHFFRYFKKVAPLLHGSHTFAKPAKRLQREALFRCITKKRLTLPRKFGFCENVQTAREWRTLFQPPKKGSAAQQPFAHFCKPHIFVAAWQPFLPKNVVLP